METEAWGRLAASLVPLNPGRQPNGARWIGCGMRRSAAGMRADFAIRDALLRPKGRVTAVMRADSNLRSTHDATVPGNTQPAVLEQTNYSMPVPEDYKGLPGCASSGVQLLAFWAQSRRRVLLA